MWIQGIWRYPVKSMAGETLASTALTEAGVDGDRILQVRGANGRIVTARTRPLLLRHHATLNPKGEVLIDGRPWDAVEVAADVAAAAGAGARLVRSSLEDRFDILPLLVATDGMIAAVGYDSRRFRPNLVIGGVPGLAERQWEGARLRVGRVIIAAEGLRSRCIITTFDPDSGAQDLGVLRRIQRDFDGRLGLNCHVVAPGQVSVGDKVELVHSA